jgi:hypothetical protein
MPHHIKAKPQRRVDPRSDPRMHEFINDVVARLDVTCTCAARLEVRTNARGRLMAAVVHPPGCPLGEHVATESGPLVANGGGEGRDGSRPPTALPLVWSPRSGTVEFGIFVPSDAGRQ